MSKYLAYKASCQSTKTVYYGYVLGDLDAARISFATGALRADGEDTGRGASLFLKECGGPTSTIEFTLVGEPHELERVAFDIRNYHRATDHHSINGPSQLPASVHAASVAHDPKVAERVIKLYSTRQMKTARLAYEAGRYPFKLMQQIKVVFGYTTEQINDLLHTKTPAEFEAQFNITIEE